MNLNRGQKSGLLLLCGMLMTLCRKVWHLFFKWAVLSKDHLQCEHFLSLNMVAIYEYMACINPWKQKAIYSTGKHFKYWADRQVISYIIRSSSEEAQFAKFIMNYDVEAWRKHHKCISYDVRISLNWSTSKNLFSLPFKLRAAETKLHIHYTGMEGARLQ